jgi:hypothetical protein
MPTRVLVLVNQAQARPTCSVHFFGCTQRAARDFETRLHDAVAEWLASQAGQSVRAQIGEACFDWGHAIDWMSPEIWRKHGLALRKGFFDPTATLMLDYQPVAPDAGEGEPMRKLIKRNRDANCKRRGKPRRALSRAQRAARALRVLERATTACPYCGSFENELLKRGKWGEHRQCARCRNRYTIRNADV